MIEVSLEHAFTIMQTRSFITEVPDDVKAEILELGLHNINRETDFLVFKSQPVETHKEDEGRTLITHVKGLSKKVYAKLDDYGQPNKWDELYDKETADDLKKSGVAQYVITFMLAEEY
jgi:hypothetical protein